MTHPGHHRGNVVRGELLKHLVWDDPLGHPGGGHGHDHVGVDVVLGALLAQRVAQPHQAQLGGAVVGLGSTRSAAAVRTLDSHLAEVAEDARHGAGHHDAAVALLPHVGPGRLHRQEGSSEYPAIIINTRH